MSRLRTTIDQPDLLVAALAALLGALAGAGTLDSIPLLRAALAIPLVLFLPGFALVNAALPALVVPAVERLLMSIGASIGLTILVGLGLGISPFTLEAQSWLLALLSLTLVLLALGWLRRAGMDVRGARPRWATMPRRGAAFVLISGLIMADVVLATRVATAQLEQPVPVQLWLVPIAGQPDQAQLGMRAGGTDGQFLLRLSSAGTVIRSFDLTLTAEQTWATLLILPPEIRAQPVVARLYQGSDPNEIRYVTLQPATEGG